MCTQPINIVEMEVEALLVNDNSWIQKGGSTIALNHTIACKITPTSNHARWAIKGKLNSILFLGVTSKDG